MIDSLSKRIPWVAPQWLAWDFLHYNFTNFRKETKINKIIFPLFPGSGNDWFFVLNDWFFVLDKTIWIQSRCLFPNPKARWICVCLHQGKGSAIPLHRQCIYHNCNSTIATSYCNRTITIPPFNSLRPTSLCWVHAKLTLAGTTNDLHPSAIPPWMRSFFVPQVYCSPCQIRTLRRRRLENRVETALYFSDEGSTMGEEPNPPPSKAVLLKQQQRSAEALPGQHMMLSGSRDILRLRCIK